MAASIGTSTLSETWRISYAQTMLNLSLKTALVVEKIAKVDNSGAKYIGNPYLTAITATAAAIDGAYTVTGITTTDDTLTVTDRAAAAVQLLEFEETLSRADLFGSLIKELGDQVAITMDKFVLNNFCNNAGQTYTTAVGGFTTPANINKIIGDLVSKVAGYSTDFSNGLFVVVESTDLTGFIQAGMTSGFNFADATLRNGFAGVFGGVEVYVVRPSTFVTATIGTLAATNSGKRLFGVKNIHTYAAPKGVQYDEKKVTLLTGREISVWANYGAKVWVPKANLFVAIILA